LEIHGLGRELDEAGRGIAGEQRWPHYAGVRGRDHWRYSDNLRSDRGLVYEFQQFPWTVQDYQCWSTFTNMERSDWSAWGILQQAMLL
jgi:hypothetical protein